MPNIDPIDSPDPVSYMNTTVHSETALKELGFKWAGVNAVDKDNHRDIWTKRSGGVHAVVVTNQNHPSLVDFYTYRITGRGISAEREETERKVNIPLNTVRKLLMGWHTEAIEVLHRLLDNDPDAFDPRADLENLARCPDCGSSNVSDADEEGILDCFNCGLWFNPMHPEASLIHKPRWRQQENLDDEIRDYMEYAMQHGDPPRIRVSFNRTTPESVEQGDFSESGWIDEEGVSMMPDDYDREDGITAVDKAVNFLKNEGVHEMSSSHFHPGVWYSTEWQTIDYSTGAEEERNYHLSGFTPDQEREIWDKMKRVR